MVMFDCYRSKMLHNWIQALFQNYASLPIAAWVLISHFLSSQDEQQDANKDNMLAL